MIFLVLFLLAFSAGFSVRRGGICLVRATQEIIDRKPAKTMFFVMEAMTVALSITIPAMFFFPEHISLAPSYDLSVYLFAGSVLFGLGAAMNNACALGTLNKLMDGNLAHLGTILGVTAGFFLFMNLDLFLTLHKLKSTSHTELNIYLFIPLTILVWGVSLFQIFKFTKQSNEKKLTKFKHYLTSPVARDFISVSIFGFCSGVIYLLIGRSCDYTKFIMDMVDHTYAGATPDSYIFPILTTTVALISGMAIATILAKNFKLQSITFKNFIIKFLAGALMGTSVGLIPGGNDTIIVHGIPGLAMHAPIALMVMMMTIATVRLINKLRAPSITA